MPGCIVQARRGRAMPRNAQDLNHPLPRRDQVATVMSGILMSAILSGWSAVAAIGLVLFTPTLAVCIAVMRSLARTLAVAILAFPLMWLLAHSVFSDASVHFPQGLFSADAGGKDQVVIVSILCTKLGGLIGAAAIVLVFSQLDAAIRARRKT